MYSRKVIISYAGDKHERNEKIYTPVNYIRNSCSVLSSILDMPSNGLDSNRIEGSRLVA